MKLYSLFAVSYWLLWNSVSPGNLLETFSNHFYEVNLECHLKNTHLPIAEGIVAAHTWPRRAARPHALPPYMAEWRLLRLWQVMGEREAGGEQRLVGFWRVFSFLRGLSSAPLNSIAKLLLTFKVQGQVCWALRMREGINSYHKSPRPLHYLRKTVTNVFKWCALS